MEGNCDPAAPQPVGDLGDRARWEQTRRPTLRLHPALFGAGVPRPHDAAEGAADGAIVGEWLAALADAPPSPWLGAAIQALRARRTLVHIREIGFREEDGSPGVAQGYYAVVGRGRAAGFVTSEDDSASCTGVEVTLREHLAGVALKAKQFAEGCGLAAPLVDDVVLAARWHDAGKVDPRFQTMLHGGSASLAATASEPLAKSKLVSADREARRRSHQRAAYPKGARHELCSVTLLEAGPERPGPPH